MCLWAAAAAAGEAQYFGLDICVATGKHVPGGEGTNKAQTAGNYQESRQAHMAKDGPKLNKILQVLNYIFFNPGKDWAEIPSWRTPPILVPVCESPRSRSFLGGALITGPLHNRKQASKQTNKQTASRQATTA